ncbi:integrase core domain-containing protein, partial [Paraburkholderia sediminicola]|uniref:integrase core domain-containing protein n=1 Tax=Paraburkholderia sediminicola TaxID=458836 RepID=UPI0038B98B7B
VAVMDQPVVLHRLSFVQGLLKRIQNEVRMRLAEVGIEPSVGSVGDSYDNALAETINGLYKAEVIHRLGPWRNLQAVEMATLEWVDWFNHRRLLAPIGNIPPAEAEAAYYSKLAGFAIAA